MPKSKATSKRMGKAHSQQRVGSCRVNLTIAEIDHLLDALSMNTLGKHHGPTDTWTYPCQINVKLCRAKRKAANR